MKRIAVIGCGGAGKSTLARRLGDILGMEVVHLDRLYWNPGWVETPNDEWDRIVEDLVKGDSWIIDGNYGRTMEIRLAAADTIIFLDYPRWICLWRVVKRRFPPWNLRPDMGPGCPEKWDWEFFGWIWKFRRDNRPTILDRLEQHAEGRQVITLHNPREATRFLDRVRRERDTIIRA